MAPRSHLHHQLSAELFCIALTRRLRLPVHTYRKRCKCKKWLDIFGDQYFDYHSRIPKTDIAAASYQCNGWPAGCFPRASQCVTVIPYHTPGGHRPPPS
eukprot:scaffold24456_cov51-Attheya_sp.AAC.2